MLLASLTTVWAFLMGGCIGSFLNVVVYRVPAGMSLVAPGSRCPKCEKPIRWYDNVPVLGWIVLRGRCRDCGVRISARYPVVEAITALMFFVVAWMEGAMGGANLPARPVPVVDGEIFRVLDSVQLTGIVAYHLVLLSTLLAVALIEFDGHRVPWHLTWPAWLVGLFASSVWPYLHPVSAGWTLDGPMAGLLDGTVGLLVGFALAMIVRPLIGLDRRAGWVIVGSCVGLFLGWQAALVLIVGSMIVVMTSRLFGWHRLPPTVWMTMGSLAWIVMWKTVVDTCPWLG